jgi:protein-L-isoaspartate(D-aspartate) O-methyltransferase
MRLLRKRMVESLFAGGYLRDARLADAFLKIPRERFVLKGLRQEAYVDKPLYIGSNQTISRPSTVAYVLEQADLEPDDRVLEIGTGSGYQTALLAELTQEVFSIEQVPELAAFARQNLRAFKYTNIRTKTGDGTRGWMEYSPFNVIIVCAVAEHLVKGLIDQLSLSGRLIIPVENEDSQQIIKIIRHRHFTERVALKECSFVKLVRGE